MKILSSLLFISFLFGSGMVSAHDCAYKTSFAYNQTPPKTVVIKAGNAADLNTFFAEAKNLAFEIYKAGTADDLNKMIEKMKAVKGVESVTAGKVTGDYAMVQVTLSANKDKAYWSKLFKTAGLTHIKINNNPIVEVEKM